MSLGSPTIYIFLLLQEYSVCAVSFFKIFLHQNDPVGLSYVLIEIQTYDSPTGTF